MEKQTDDTGQFEKEVSDDRLVAAVSNLEPAGTTEVSDAVGMTRPGAYRRLQELDDDGRVDVSRIGGSLVWSSAEGGRDDTEVVGGGVDHGAGTDAEELTTSVDDDLRDRVKGVLDDGEYAVTPERVGAAVAVVETVREQGEVTTSEAERIARASGIRLGTTGQWWSEAARELECVSTTRGSNTYRWVGDDGGETA